MKKNALHILYIKVGRNEHMHSDVKRGSVSVLAK